MLTPDLDIRTLLAVVSSVALVNAITWATFSRRHATFAGLGWFAAANAMLAVGMYLVSIRGSLPDLATTVLANLVTLSGLLLNHEGLRRFARAEWSPWRTPLWLLLPLLVGSTWFTLVQPSVQGRILMFTGLAAVGCAWIAVDLTRSEAATRARLRPTAWVFGGFAALLTVRWFVTAGAVPLEDFMEAGRIHALTLVAYIAFILVKDLTVFDAAVSILIADGRRLADIDPLTGLANRRVALDRGARGLAAAQRDGLEYSVVMVDVDHFKSINDRHGHAVGDAVLVRMASLLAAAIPADGLCARIGGEEFLLLLPGIGTREAAGLAERIREAIAGHAWPEPSGRGRTASFGVAAARPGSTLDETIRRADRALLQAKEDGRDRVVIDDVRPGTDDNLGPGPRGSP
jgi:diguanylate cyclase (GGDEF)-like protein